MTAFLKDLEKELQWNAEDKMACIEEPKLRIKSKEGEPYAEYLRRIYELIGAGQLMSAVKEVYAFRVTGQRLENGVNSIHLYIHNDERLSAQGFWELPEETGELTKPIERWDSRKIDLDDRVRAELRAQIPKYQNEQQS